MHADRTHSPPPTGCPDRLASARITDGVLGAFYDVYNELGSGYIESVYDEAMAVALAERSVSFEREPPLRVHFRGRAVGLFKPDFLVGNEVIVELKAVRALVDEHRLQLLNYLRSSAFEVGLLLNFGPKPTFERMVFANSRKRIRVDPR